MNNTTHSLGNPVEQVTLHLVDDTKLHFDRLWLKEQSGMVCGIIEATEERSNDHDLLYRFPMRRVSHITEVLE